MKNNDYEVYFTCLLGVISYIVFVLMVFNSLGQVNHMIKESIFKHYNVPLPKE